MKISTGKSISLGLLLLHLLILIGGSIEVSAADDSPEIPLIEENHAIPGLESTSGDRVDGSWWDGQVQWTTVINYLGNPEYGFGTWVGYWQNVELGHPRVGELYTVKVSVYGVGSPASGLQAAVMNFKLPPGTQIEASYPIRCFGGSEWLEITDGCPQVLPYDSLKGTYNIPSDDEGNVWPIAPGAGWEFWIPVKTTTTLSGVNFMGVIDNIEAMNSPDKLFPTVPIYVFESTPPPGPFNKVDPLNGADNIPVDTFLEWQDSSNVTTYEYCIDTIDDDACLPWVDWSNLFNVLSPNTTYFWHIRAINAGGITYSNGSPTAFWSFTTEEATSAPEAFGKSLPLNNATNVPTDLTLRWNESSGVSNYEYCYDTSNDGTCTTWVDIGLSTSTLLSGLATDTTYYWHVRAVNDQGTTYANGSSTAFWSFTTEDSISPPGAFSKAVPADGAADISTDLTLYWGTSSSASSYEYCYDTSNDNACAAWTNNGTSTSKSLSGLANGTTYYWHVRARNNDGVTYSNGSSTAFWSFRTADPISPPGAFSKTIPVDGAIDISRTPTLHWGTSSGVTYYEYCYDTINDDECAIWVNNGLSTSKTLSTLANGVTYYWHVRARNSDGITYSNGSETAFWSFTTMVPIAPNDGVLAIAVQPEGRILIGGYFTAVNGVGRSRIARLNPDGSLDVSFDPSINGRVDAIAIQPDGKILVGGAFTYVGLDPRSWIARLNPDGTLDESFMTSLDGTVYAILVQPDGRILIGGNFKKINGVERTYIGLLTKEGILDTSFNDINLDNIVRTLAVQEDGKILIGGAFKYVNSVRRTHIARLSKDGVLDETFHPEFDDFLVNLVIQPDGKILVGGQFTEVNLETHEHIVRLEPSGAVDGTFIAQANDSIASIALQGDGKMLIGGYFTQVNKETHNHLVRLDSEGNVDISLNLDANNLVTGLGLQSNGMILVGGLFTQVNEEDHYYFARLRNNSLAASSISIAQTSSDDSLTWALRNASPQVDRVTFEQSTNGTNYTFLGDGDYVSGNWVLDGLDLPMGQEYWIRARGYYSTGRFNGSGSILQTVTKINCLFLPMVMK